MDEVTAKRRVTKSRMIALRGGPRNLKCDLCEKKVSSVDMHELINRGRTIRNTVAREMSYKEELCSLLCRECHKKAHNPDVRNTLLRKNVSIYGFERVSNALENLMKVAMIDIPLPEELTQSDNNK